MARSVKLITSGLSSPGYRFARAVKGEVMPVNEAVTVCDFCQQKRVTWTIEQMAFRQWSDKGYVHCRMELSVGTCQGCGSKSLEPGSDQILDAAFQEEYRKLP
jgi:hypothetical protein